ncbi:RICIN domain-containing protein [Larkinella soli]|uniref:RICIN domain-containing protein n=1 Tax=Larkinella soli TaxID=1770527 RepID=UPI001E601217|nr:RICIN domain-containing protein [Larkinella soli]
MIPALFGNSFSQEKRYVRNASEYAQKLQYVIQQSRNDLKRTVPWVVARTSYESNQVSSIVIDGQNLTLGSGLPFVHSGPSTDGITDREDGTHFNLTGLTKAADGWTSSILALCQNPNGGRVTVQDLGTEAQSISISADGSTVSAPAGTSYSWVRDDGTTTDLDAALCFDQTIGSNCTGRYRAVVKNGDGNLILSQAVDFPYTIVDDTGSGTTSSAPLANGCYTIRAKHSGKLLQVADNNNGTRIRQQDANGSPNQIFRLEAIDNHSAYRIIATPNNKIWDAAGASTNLGTPIHQYDWNGSAQQKWRIEPYGDGTYKLIPSYASGMAVDVEGVSLDNGAGIFLWSQHGNDNQRFAFQSTGCPGTFTPTNPTNPPGGAYEGFLDGADCNNLWGWVWDRNQPNTPLTLELLANGTVVGAFSAAEYRADLVGAGKGDGRHGFNYAPPAAIKNGQSQSLTVRVQGSSYALTGSPKTVTCAGSGTTPPPSPPPTGGNLSGCYRIRSVQTGKVMEALGNQTVEQREAGGSNAQTWRAEAVGSQYRFVTQNGSGQVMSVNGWGFGEPLRLSAPTGDSRQHWTLQDNGSGAWRVSGGTGVTWDLRGFGAEPALQLWGTTAEGFQNHRLFRFESVGCPGGTTPPPTTPTGSNPAGPYEGHLDVADCRNIGGWVYSQSSPNTALSIDVLANGNVVGSLTAANYRQDLQNAGKGDGRHGFNFPTPSAIKNGSSQAISVRVTGQGFTLTGSPKTISCPSGSRKAAEAETAGELILLVYPNPSDGPFQVQFYAPSDTPSRLEVLDLTGRRLLLREVRGTDRMQEETMTLPTGVRGEVLIRLLQGKKQVTKKVLLQP